MFRKIALGAASAMIAVSVLVPSATVLADMRDPIGVGSGLFFFEEKKDDEEEGAKGFVSRIYTIALGRDPEEEGLNYWTGLLMGQKNTGLEIFKSITNCPEFTDKNLNNEEYLKVLYKVFFDREPESAGFEFWYNDLEDGLLSKDDVLWEFAGSDEWHKICDGYGILPGGPTKVTTSYDSGIEGFVKRLYDGCLGRPADEDGLKFWVNDLSQKNVTGKKAAYGFFTSDEFKTAAKDMTPEELVRRYYNVFLNREPESSGEAFWVETVSKSVNPVAELFNGFSDSQEFTDLCVANGIEPGESVRINIVAPDPAYDRFKDYYLYDGVTKLDLVTNLQPKTTYKFCNVQGSERVWEERTIPEADIKAINNFAATYFDPSWTNGEKASFLLYWVHNNMVYSGGTSNFAVSALEDKSGQCAQYNGVMVEFLCLLGYDAVLIQGSRGRSAPGAQHYWCEVYIDGEPYVVEVGNTKDGNWNYFVEPYCYTSKFIVCGQVMG
ncbi:MAG: DUF4214 domain-containing protein [Clostridiales bacterium]|nr:DUF4214 domain-containing protein [Clostridiales bacterium]